VDIEDRVVILCLDSPAFVYAFFGAIKLGAIPVPANTLLIPRDLAYILRDSRAVAIVVSAPLLPKVLEIRKDCPRLRHILVTTSGTAALATGGSGDVLTGIAGTLLAQMANDAANAGEAAGCAAFVHGRAAERCRFVRGITLSDVLQALPLAWNEKPRRFADGVIAELESHS